MKLQAMSFIRVCLCGVIVFGCSVAPVLAQELENPFRDRLSTDLSTSFDAVVERPALQEASYRSSAATGQEIILAAPATFIQDESALQAQPEPVIPESAGVATGEVVKQEEGIVIQGDGVYGSSLSETLGCDGGIGCG